MWKDAAMLTVACVLYINMGLHDAIVKRIGFSLPITGCPKCLCFWSVLLSNILHRSPIVECVAVSFLCSYSALWLSLAYDALSTLYNKLYERITNQADAKSTDPETLSYEDSEAGADAMPQM